jgi:glycosyltransferase involved in cell wall biosynthesis
MNVSVCMATYNGAAYVEEQVNSILEQLSAADELIVIDDCSGDDTVALLERSGDPRIVIHRNEVNRGHVYSFEKAIALARNPVVLLADQDDRWLSGRVRLLVEALRESGALVVTSNSNYMGADGRTTEHFVRRLHATDSRRHLKNIVGIFLGTASYYGCAMAFRRELVALILPVPHFVESHDLWIALASNLVRSNAHVDADTLTRRIHGKNLSTSRRSLLRKLRTRLKFLRSLAVLAGRYLGRRVRDGLRGSLSR